MDSRRPFAPPSNVLLPVQRQPPLTSTVPFSSSTLGKRGAADAGLETAAGGHRRALSSATAIQAKLLAAERREAEALERVEEQRVEIERLKSERRMLYEGETFERTTAETREKEWAEERLNLSSQVRELRNQNTTLNNSLQQLELQHAQLTGQHTSLTQNTNSEISLLMSRIEEIEAERDALKGWERRAKGLSIELEEEKRRAEERRRNREDQAEDRRGDEVLRKEFRRQSQQYSGYQVRISQLELEVTDLRQKKKEADVAERASKDVEWGLREEIRTLQSQLERSQREMDSLTHSFPTSPTSEDLPTLQSRLVTLSDLHSKATAELAAKNTELRTLESRLAEHTARSFGAIKDLTAQVTELEREARWAKEGRVSAERREALLQKEVDAMRDLSGTPTPGVFTGNQAARVAQLEKLVESYRSELEAISRDSRDLEERLTQGAGLVKQSALDEAQAKIAQLEKNMEALDSTIAQLTSANTTLDAEVNDLMRRVASGEYNPATERCIELKANPAAKEQAIRTKMLEDLRAENEALLERLRSVDRQPVPDKGMGLVPRESFERLSREKEEMERAHAKRLLRLKEIFGMKSKEFLEAVYSLLGWRIKFDESGADIRLTSMYAPKGKMGLTLKFASQEGHFGTMQMTGAMAKGLEESRHFWITERQSVPGFLAQVTTEMFEKTTIGRAAGYVGLE